MHSARRRHETLRVSANRKKLANIFGIEGDNHWFDHHPLDCGRPNCGLCDPHSDSKDTRKYYKRQILKACAEISEDDRINPDPRRIQ